MARQSFGFSLTISRQGKKLMTVKIILLAVSDIKRFYEPAEIANAEMVFAPNKFISICLTSGDKVVIATKKLDRPRTWLIADRGVHYIQHHFPHLTSVTVLLTTPDNLIQFCTDFNPTI